MTARAFTTAALLTLCAALLAPCAAPIAAQEAADSPRLSFDGIELTIGGRVQTQFNTTSVDAVEGSELILRRARLELEAQVNELVSVVIEPEFAGDEIALKDTYVRLAFSPAFQVIAGNAKRPFSRFELTSSKRMMPVERGLRIRGLQAYDEYALVNGLAYSDRDIGVLVAGAPENAPLGFGYAAGVFRGPLDDVLGESTYQYAARVTFAPAELLSFGAAWSSREFADGGIERGHAFEIDAEYGAFAPGLHVIAEAAFGDLDPFTDTDFRGAQGWLAWRSQPPGETVTGIEPVLRVSWGDIDELEAIPAPGGLLLTPGINVYFGPLNRLMINYDVWRGANGTPDAQSLKIMLQAAF